jgi:hypothetical protein
MLDKDRNFWKYVLKYARWLFEQQQLWKLLLPFYLIAAGVWFVVYYQGLLVQRVLQSNSELKINVDSLTCVLKKQQAEFKLILMDVMGDYGDVTPSQAVFLNKTVPLNHLSARQSLNWIYRYLFKHKMEVRDALERFHFYEAAIIDTLRKNNLPMDLRFVFLAESWAYPLAVSKAGAAGGWQFMRYTAAEVGVEISHSVDMRRDVWYMSKTFCDYIKYLRRHSKSLPAALRAYNTGIDRFLRAAARQSWVTKVWFVDTNDENNIYLFWVLAWKFIYSKPLEFGIKVNYNFPPLKLKVIKIRLDSRRYRENLTFLAIAKATGCDLFLLKDLNPAFLKVNRRGYRIIPGSRLKRYVVRYFKLPASVDLVKLKQIKLRGVKLIF